MNKRIGTRSSQNCKMDQIRYHFSSTSQVPPSSYFSPMSASTMEIELPSPRIHPWQIGSSSLLLSIYPWALKNSIPLPYLRKFTTIMQTVDHVKQKAHHCSTGVLRSSEHFCSITHRLRHQPLTPAHIYFLVHFSKLLKDNFWAHSYICGCLIDLNGGQR